MRKPTNKIILHTEQNKAAFLQAYLLSNNVVHALKKKTVICDSIAVSNKRDATVIRIKAFFRTKWLMRATTKLERARTRLPFTNSIKEKKVDKYIKKRNVSKTRVNNILVTGTKIQPRKETLITKGGRINKLVSRYDVILNIKKDRRNLRKIKKVLMQVSALKMKDKIKEYKRLQKLCTSRLMKYVKRLTKYIKAQRKIVRALEKKTTRSHKIKRSIVNIFKRSLSQRLRIRKQHYIIIENLNLSLNIEQTRVFYKHLYDYKSMYLFVRTRSFFIDLIKVTDLLAQKKMSASSLIYIFSLIFKSLHKRQHFFFTTFITRYFISALACYKEDIRGFRFILSGRILGKDRAQVIKIKRGVLEANTIKSNLSFTQTHVYTVYGTYGFKLWVNLKV